MPNDILFYLSVYKDSMLALDTIKTLKNLYNYKIFVRSDGLFHKEISQEPYINYMTDSRRKTKGSGGIQTHRYLSLSLNYDFEYLVKLDPDTFPQKIFNFDNFSSCSINCNKSLRNNIIQGGIIGFPREVIKKIVNSNILLKEKFKTDAYNYFCVGNDSHVACQDLILSECIKELEIPIKTHQGFEVFGKYVNLFENKDAYFLHPVKSFRYRNQYRKEKGIII